MSDKDRRVRVLVADDQHDILRSAQMLFKSEGIGCTTCSTPGQVLKVLEVEDAFDALVIDLNYQSDTTSGNEGLSLISDIRKISDSVPIIVMTAWASIDIAVEAMKQGANDFISKPWDVDRLLSIIKTQIALNQALAKQNRLECENRVLRDESSPSLLFASDNMKAIEKSFSQISASDACVLITGENGTGKTQLARLCHAMSSRSDESFIAVNMGALNESVFESEMFGHEKGAFTGAQTLRVGRFELADGGTLFLDEVANISEKQQAALLRLLESGEFERVGSSKTRKANVRIICATNADLLDSVATGAFRQDLYYRICTVPVRVPPLRERQDDVVQLADYFLARFSKKYKKTGLAFTDDAYQSLKDYRWPGNVRELEHCIERTALLVDGLNITEDALGLDVSLVPKDAQMNTDDFDGLTLAQVEYKLLDAALTKYIRKPDEAAKALGISRSAFYRKLAKHGFDLA